MSKIDRSTVRKSFNKGAPRYEDTVIVQKMVIEQILSNLEKLSPQHFPLRILDVGAGTGLLLRSLRKSCPEAFLAGLDLSPGMGVTATGSLPEDGNFLYVVGDAEDIPFADETFDLVVSTSTFQWLSALGKAFSEAKRVLAPGGMFLFALFGEGTLHELKSSYRSVLLAENAIGKDRSHNFFPREVVEKDLYEVGFSEITVENYFEKEYYPDVPAFLRALKGIGAGTAASRPAGGLGGRRIITKMMEFYQRNFSDERGVPVSYEVIHGKGMKV
ncbi:MAG: methyltransferase domain-containing protein [Geobacteraceae bacterium]|nr:methyltransferase domain-containing protein [Geobacteraceae bacterium]